MINSQKYDPILQCSIFQYVEKLLLILLEANSDVLKAILVSIAFNKEVYNRTNFQQFEILVVRQWLSKHLVSEK